jgi:hypothetical protein
MPLDQRSETNIELRIRNKEIKCQGGEENESFYLTDEDDIIVPDEDIPGCYLTIHFEN